MDLRFHLAFRVCSSYRISIKRSSHRADSDETAGNKVSRRKSLNTRSLALSSARVPLDASTYEVILYGQSFEIAIWPVRGRGRASAATTVRDIPGVLFVSPCRPLVKP